MLPTRIFISGSGGDAEEIRPEQIPAEYAEWFKRNLLWQCLTFRGRVYVVRGDVTLGDEARLLSLHPKPHLTPPGLEVSELLVPFTIRHR